MKKYVIDEFAMENSFFLDFIYFVFNRYQLMPMMGLLIRSHWAKMEQVLERKELLLV